MSRCETVSRSDEELLNGWDAAPSALCCNVLQITTFCIYFWPNLILNTQLHLSRNTMDSIHFPVITTTLILFTWLEDKTTMTLKPSCDHQTCPLSSRVHSRLLSDPIVVSVSLQSHLSSLLSVFLFPSESSLVQSVAESGAWWWGRASGEITCLTTHQVSHARLSSCCVFTTRFHGCNLQTFRSAGDQRIFHKLDTHSHISWLKELRKGKSQRSDDEI